MSEREYVVRNGEVESAKLIYEEIIIRPFGGQVREIWLRNSRAALKKYADVAFRI